MRYTSFLRMSAVGFSFFASRSKSSSAEWMSLVMMPRYLGSKGTVIALDKKGSLYIAGEVDVSEEKVGLFKSPKRLV